MSRLIMQFPTDEDRDDFVAYFSDGGGEGIYLDMSPDLKVNYVDYAKAFEAWGYEPDVDGDPVIEFKWVDDEIIIKTETPNPKGPGEQ